MDIERSPELEAVVRRVWTNFAAGNGPALANMTSRDPAVRFILSADDEWFSHADRIAELMTERSERIGTQRLEFDRVEGYQAGDVGWVALELTVHFATGDSATFRQTGVFVVEDGVWRTIQSHTSRGVPAEETFGYAMANVLADLVGSLTENDGQDIAAAASSSGLVTLMFTDIEGSTRLSHEHGESEWIRMVQDHFDEIGRHVAANGGAVVKTLGDGAMAAFPTARGAAEAALAIQRSESHPGLRVRIGIHTGEAVAVGADYAGIAVAKAARVASAAAGGEILVSSATKELLAGFDFPFGAERSADLKGIPGTHRLIPLLT
ncbi:MAG TPA: adenylate/guanylate cyclase domain-containing protein [Acidimicrobiia bacterium]|nr:adenylate/guanylate cyclase domain-containing protein [Acidimicrobiia bacterium]